MRGRQILVLLITAGLIKIMLDTAEYIALQEVGVVFGKRNELSKNDEHAKRQTYWEDDRDEALTRNFKRIRWLNKSCAEMSDTKITRDIRAHMSPNNTVLYCRVNKCASTMTLELLKRLFDCDTECLITNAQLVKQDTLNTMHIMRRAFSFIVVREPYSRIFSSYCNIFYFPKEDWFYRSTKIIRQVREKPLFDSLKYGHDLTFAELIKYIVESFEAGIRIDEHVRPMSHKSCNPCSFRFDFIVKLETIMSDFEYLLREWKRRKVVFKYDTAVLSDLREWTLYGPIKHLFRVIPLIKNSNVSLYNVFLRAWSYYQITGQVSKQDLFPYKERELDKITMPMFRRNLEKAINVSLNASYDLRTQRMEAMKEAYSTVPKEYIDRLRRVVRLDCSLFGYDQKPRFLENITSFSRNGTFYFKGLNS